MKEAECFKKVVEELDMIPKATAKYITCNLHQLMLGKKLANNDWKYIINCEAIVNLSCR